MQFHIHLDYVRQKSLMLVDFFRLSASLLSKCGSCSETCCSNEKSVAHGKCLIFFLGRMVLNESNTQAVRFLVQHITSDAANPFLIIYVKKMLAYFARYQVII